MLLSTAVQEKTDLPILLCRPVKPAIPHFSNVSLPELKIIMSSQRLLSGFIKRNSKFIFNIIHIVHNTYKVNNNVVIFDNIIDELYSCGMMAMWRGIERYDADIAKLSTYLYTVIYRDVKREYEKYIVYHTKHQEIELYAHEDGDEMSGEYNEAKFRGDIIGREAVSLEDEVIEKDTYEYIAHTFPLLTRKICYCMFTLKLNPGQIQKHLGITKSQYEGAFKAKVRRKIAKMLKVMKEI